MGGGRWSILIPSRWLPRDKPGAALENFCRRTKGKVFCCNVSFVNTLPPALAVIDGTLCQLTRQGARSRWHEPLATAVVEFRHGPLCTYVREHPYGLLPGIPNLYCLDGDLRLQWMAEWPDPADPCTQIIDQTGPVLRVESASGMIVQLSAHTGRLLGIELSLAASG